MSDDLMALTFRAHEAWKDYGRTYQLASRKGERKQALRAAVEAEDALAEKDRKRMASKRRLKIAA